MFQGCSNLKTITFKKPDSQHNLGIQNNSDAVSACIRYDGENRIMQDTPISYLSAKTLVFRPCTQTVSDGMCGVNTKLEISRNDYILTLSKHDLGISVGESKYNHKNPTEVPRHIYRKDLKGVTIGEGITKSQITLLLTAQL